jgi:hypothetical protein
MLRLHLFCLIFLLLQKTFFVNGQGCIAGYTYQASVNLCTKLVVTTGTATAARTACVSSGGVLISVTSLALHNFVYTTFAQTNNVWIGLLYSGTAWTW